MSERFNKGIIIKNSKLKKFLWMRKADDYISFVSIVFLIISYITLIGTMACFLIYLLVSDLLAKWIVCKNCFGVIQKISIEDALCTIQELPTYFNWMTSINKKWICIYCKDNNFRFVAGCSNSRKKKGIQIIYTDNNYELIGRVCQINTI